MNAISSHVKQIAMVTFVEDQAKGTVAAMERVCVSMDGQDQPVIVLQIRVPVETQIM